MSELALGRRGGFMVVAFVGLATAVAATAAHLRAQAAPKLLTHTLALAAASLVGAGEITLGDSVRVHVALVALAFVMCGLAMYLLPRLTRSHRRPLDHLMSWGSCLLMCAATALGGSFIPVGVAQRVSAGALMFWLLWVVWRRGGDKPFTDSCALNAASMGWSTIVNAVALGTGNLPPYGNHPSQTLEKAELSRSRR